MDRKAIYRRFVDDVVVGGDLSLVDELFAADVVLPAQGDLDGLRLQGAGELRTLVVKSDGIRDIPQFIVRPPECGKGESSHLVWRRCQINMASWAGRARTASSPMYTAAVVTAT